MRQAKKTRQSQFPHSPAQLRVAIAHDSYLYEGGAERVLRRLLKLFPQADVFVALIKPRFRAGLARKHHIITSPFSVAWLPERWASFLKPFIRWWWRSLDFSQYNLVISSSHSFSSKALRVGGVTRHISYIYTPPRFLYDEFNEMNWLRWSMIRWLLSGVLGRWRTADFHDAQGPDILITSSRTTQGRIQKHYQRASTVIFPPVDVKGQKTSATAKRRYFLFHSRLVKQKGAELVIKTFNKLKLPLVVVGDGSERKRLERLAGPTITFLGFVPDKQLTSVYSSAKALVFAAQDEDFGLVPVEAMARGVPVIAFRSGGVTETVVPGKTGLLFDEYSLESLEKALEQFEKIKWSKAALRQHVARFSAKRFDQQFMKIVTDQMAGKKRKI